MLVKDLLKGIKYKVEQGTDNVEVSHIFWDSRKVKPNSLFICVKGRNVDRHDFAQQAVEAGAAVLIIEHGINGMRCNTNIIRVDDTREVMACIANNFYCEPSKHLSLIGITGTNGKTSVSWFIAKILEAAGRKTGIIGTIENRIGNEKIRIEKLNPTTPDSIELQATLKEILDEGVADVAMEVTSAALANHRVDRCHFDIGVFTNLTQDHLDEHGTMENYKNAKLKLFSMCRYGVINADDPVYADIIKYCASRRFVSSGIVEHVISENHEIKGNIEYASCEILKSNGMADHAPCTKLLSYGITNKADFMAENIEYSLTGVKFTLNFNGIRKAMQLKVPGKFSVYNALAAIGACYLSGLTLEQIAEGLDRIEGVKGRFEAVPNPKGCMVIVDYAHTPDGLENILGSVKELAKKKVITVFGCGGDRDRTKRPVMGEIAGKWSDLCILTSDNPRTEDPVRVIEDIEVGICKTSCPYEKITGRREAIYRALDAAEVEDIVVITGKGHETYQMFENHVIHFDDSEVVKEYFAKKIGDKDRGWFSER